MKHIAIYMRVSTNQQSTRSQKPDLERWLQAQGPDTSVKWYTDKATGKNMDRPGWQKLQEAISRDEVDCITCWRLDRLGRTAAGLCKLFEQLQAKSINLVSLKESIDLKSASGRLLANILASVAAFETELRGERVKAGQQAARQRGITWGGSQKGRLAGITPQQVKTIFHLQGNGEKISNIAKSVGVDRSSVYRILKNVQAGHIKCELNLAKSEV
jgi:DNA invertase Pin-like site-specific DNA recombinase